MDSLKKYNEKRNFSKTKEPFGKKESPNKKLRFCVQHHLARKDHYDFRLEWQGTMISFAIPKGPSYNPNDKRLAIHVENHPLSYRKFEGTISKGEYGGGVVMLWDEGYWYPLEKVKNFKNSSLKFILDGKRLKGMWTLVPFKDDNYLLIKEKDNEYSYSNINDFKTSIKTGRTMAEIASNKKPLPKNSKKENIVERVKITHPEKLIYNNPKITKMAIVNYYNSVAEVMLPFIKQRILSTIRFPTGIDGESFFKKHLETDSEGIGLINLSNNNSKKEDYYYIRDKFGLISEVQMNSFEFHIWGSRIPNYNTPDLLVFDLDPDKSVSLKKIRDGVKDLKSILDELNLTSFLKTSGGKGYHIVVPTKKFKTWNKAQEFAKNIAILMATKWPDKYTSNVRKENRKGKIFIDWLRNTKGATSVAPYSLRIRKKCRVSMPIKWSELDKIKPDGITINDALKRIKRKNPWDDFCQDIVP